MNIAGLVLQEKIENHELKEALLDSSLVLGYEYLEIEEKYSKAKVDFTKSFAKLSPENKTYSDDSSYLAILVYIYYVKGKLEKESNKALDNYKIAFEKFNLLKSCFISNFDLFTLDLNILYNGNVDIVASLYRQLNDLDSSNAEYHESFKVHLLNELDYLMQQNRWKDADQKNTTFILVSAKKEKQGYLELNDIKNFNCKDLKAVDELWVKNSKGKFGFSVQKRIYLDTGNSLDFDWEKKRFTKWSNEGYNSFAERVGWKKKYGWITSRELPLPLEWGDLDLDEDLKECGGNWGDDEDYEISVKRGMLPLEIYVLWGGYWGKYRKRDTPLFLQRLVDCSR
ncbi:GUN4 domain-containing protein [Dolichospermum sp. LEGE 00240]|uniref:GUN4 domain-containing protein n=1 Tax=Dolichospermum sp. LEGE 00240 TaxID=1828603 RepID=UPI001D137A84|nr:GUN4 domain-containing protein [Dolichospermum sp. LEGE 00240]